MNDNQKHLDKDAMQAVGQKLVDTIGAETPVGVDLMSVLDVLISVVAHYIGGIPDEELRLQAYGLFGRNLKQAIEQTSANDAKAMINLTGPGVN